MFGNRRNRQADRTRQANDHRIHLARFDQAAVFHDGVVHAVVLIDEDQFDRCALDPAGAVDFLHLQTGGLLGRHAENGPGARQIGGHADAYRLSRLGRLPQSERSTQDS
ncbi:hypothetical protein D9M68_927620 [compost metagenome]